ncbi:hypothetical protein DMA12_15430 [Amycolatopsis balhimycina DSM 5908]|uniref:FAD-binding domain-containing protein n=2 Tax=Amycolatopsis balhimycina TaxID=208443 RepID=A0A428WPB1_AMYBA|nr:hypothetical protein DMA12_15430 [Amycolatopsis balhimycina DSM 5908]
MATAALLDAAGIAVDVLEQTERPSDRSKATTVHPRTLEVLRSVRSGSISLADRMVAAGTPLPATHFGLLPELLDYRNLDTPFPFVLMLPQADTEAMLAAHLAARGVPVSRGVRVDHIAGEGDAVRLSCGGPGGAHARTAQWVVGADGARSTVRRALGIGFPGTEPTLCGFIADVELDAPPAHPHLWNAATGSLNALPLPSGGFRVFGCAARDTGLDPVAVRERRARPLARGELRELMTAIAGTDWGLRKVIWSSRNTDVTRHVERNRLGRVLLVGDAAHIHLPAGGQGMNVGIQDAANLAWKLAAEIHGWAPTRVVTGAQSYQAERLPIARRLADNTLAQAAISMTFSPAGAALRRLLGDLIAQGGDAAGGIAGWLSGLDVHYPPPGGAHPLAGHRVPDLSTEHSSLHALLAPDRFVLAAFGGPVPEVPVSTAPAATVVPAATAKKWAGLTLGLVRPDGHLADGWPRHPTPETLRSAVACWTQATSNRQTRNPS